MVMNCYSMVSFSVSDTEIDIGFYVVSNSYTCDVFLETWAKISMSNRKVFRLYFNYLFFCPIFLSEPYIQGQRSCFIMSSSMIRWKEVKFCPILGTMTLRINQRK